MKKIIALLAVLTFMVTGCGESKVTCSIKEDYMETKTEATFKDGKFLDGNVSIYIENDEYFDKICDMLGKYTCKNNTIYIDNISDYLYSSSGYKEMSKKDFIKELEALGYTCK